MGTGQPNVNGQSLSKLRLPLPPLKEQQKNCETLRKYIAKNKRFEINSCIKAGVLNYQSIILSTIVRCSVLVFLR